MLTGRQRKYLRNPAHNIDPIFQTGKARINNNMISQTDKTFENRELVKIHMLQSNFNDKNDLAQTLSQAVNSEVVQVTGPIIVIYRESQENKGILLP